MDIDNLRKVLARLSKAKETLDTAWDALNQAQRRHNDAATVAIEALKEAGEVAVVFRGTRWYLERSSDETTTSITSEPFEHLIL